jgi:hypothetical protein
LAIIGSRFYSQYTPVTGVVNLELIPPVGAIDFLYCVCSWNFYVAATGAIATAVARGIVEVKITAKQFGNYADLAPLDLIAVQEYTTNMPINAITAQGGMSPTSPMSITLSRLGNDRITTALWLNWDCKVNNALQRYVANGCAYWDTED